MSENNILVSKLFYTMILIFIITNSAYSTCKRSIKDKSLKSEEELSKILRESLKNKKLFAVFEANFLQFLGLSKRPRKNLNKKRVRVPPKLWKIFNKWTNRKTDDDITMNSDTARVIYHSIAQDHVQRKLKTKKLKFDISKISKDEKLHKAELHLFTENNRKQKPFLKNHKFVKIYHQSQDSKNKSNTNLLHIKKMQRQKVGYLKIDVTNVVESWRNNSVKDTSFIIDDNDNHNEEDDHIQIRQRRSITRKEWADKRPLLLVYSLSNKEKPEKIERRKKRQAYKKNKKNNKKMLNKKKTKDQKEICRLRKFYLSFKDVSWDGWILAPTGYDINYCYGECPQPLGSHYNTTNHAVIQNTILSTENSKELVPPLCCIPTTLKDQSILYLDPSGQILIKEPVDMIALGCGCQ